MLIYIIELMLFGYSFMGLIVTALKYSQEEERIYQKEDLTVERKNFTETIQIMNFQSIGLTKTQMQCIRIKTVIQ